ncbi:hypothetical protein MRB53_039243 [Persea americana]|nr:hypothetical protein MRB53_039243 [Persea americana]
MLSGRAPDPAALRQLPDTLSSFTNFVPKLPPLCTLLNIRSEVDSASGAGSRRRPQSSFLVLSYLLPATTSTDQFLNYDIGLDLTVGDFKEFVAAECGLDPRIQVLLLHGKVLAEGYLTLEASGVKEGDLLVINVKPASEQWEQPPQPLKLSPAEQALNRLRKNILASEDSKLKFFCSDPRIRPILEDLVIFIKATVNTKEGGRMITRWQTTNFAAPCGALDHETMTEIDEILRQYHVMLDYEEMVEENPERRSS